MELNDTNQIFVWPKLFSSSWDIKDQIVYLVSYYSYVPDKIGKNVPAI